MERKITPVWIFDGAPSELKSDTVKKRESKKVAAERIKEESLAKGDFITAIKAAKQAISLKPQEVEHLKELLNYAGVPYAPAESEADHKIAQLSRSKLIGGVISDDSDLLTHGVDILLRPFGADSVDVYDREAILKELGLTQEQFVDLCILMGTDYNDSPDRMGAKTAFKLIREHGCIEQIIKTNTKFDLKDIETRFLAVRAIFDEINSTENDIIRRPTFDEAKLNSFFEQRKFKDENRERFTARFKKLASA